MGNNKPSQPGRSRERDPRGRAGGSGWRRLSGRRQGEEGLFGMSFAREANGRFS